MLCLLIENGNDNERMWFINLFDNEIWVSRTNLGMGNLIVKGGDNKNREYGWEVNWYLYS